VDRKGWTAQKLASLSLPKPNPFIPRDFTLKYARTPPPPRAPPPPPPREKQHTKASRALKSAEEKGRQEREAQRPLGR